MTKSKKTQNISLSSWIESTRSSWIESRVYADLVWPDLTLSDASIFRFRDTLAYTRKCCKYLRASSTNKYLQLTILKIPALIFSTIALPSSTFSPNRKSATRPLTVSLEQHPGGGSSSENHPSNPKTNLPFPLQFITLKTPLYPSKITSHVTFTAPRASNVPKSPFLLSAAEPELLTQHSKKEWANTFI